MTDRIPGFATLAIHAGAQPDPDHRRARHADLSDHLVRVRGRRPRRLAVRPADLRQHLYAHRQSDQRGAGGARRRARRRHRGPRGRLRPRRAGGGHALPDAPGRRVRRLQEALWRLDQPVQSRLQEFRLERGVGRARRCRHLRARHHAQDQGDLHRIHRQSRRRHHRHRGDRQDREERGRAAHRRQHAGHALSLQADRLRRRHRRAFAHQVSRRPRQLDRRPDRRRRHLQLVAREALSDAVRAASGISRHRAARDLRQLRLRHRLPRAGAARHRAGAVAVQRLPDPHRHRDAAAAHAAPLRQRAGGGAVAGRSSPRWPG